jgi:hypothetical protein
MSGISGTGVVAEGAVWSSGAVALHWPGRPRATSVWASLDDLRSAHGDEGATEVRFLDDRAEPESDPVERAGSGWPVLPERCGVVPLPDPQYERATKPVRVPDDAASLPRHPD